jgi:hypothetical protein
MMSWGLFLDPLDTAMGRLLGLPGNYNKHSVPSATLRAEGKTGLSTGWSFSLPAPAGPLCRAARWVLLAFPGGPPKPKHLLSVASLTEFLLVLRIPLK